MRAAFVRFTLILITALGPGALPAGRASAEDGKDPAGGMRHFVVTGRILDGYAEGVHDAKVKWIPDEPSGDRSSAPTVRTDAGGHFALDVDGPAHEESRGTIHVTRGDDEAVFEPVHARVGVAKHDVGSRTLRRARPLEIEVRREDAAVPGALVRIWGWAGSMYHGQPAFLGTATTAASGRATLDAVPHTYFKLHVAAPDGSVGELTKQLVPGEAASRVRVGLSPSRAVRVRVTNDADPPEPIAGAEVTRQLRFALEDVVHSFDVQIPSRLPRTGDAFTRVEGLPDDRTAYFLARAAGRPVGRTRCGPGETTATIVIPRPSIISVKAGELPPPPDGTRLRLWTRRGTETSIEAWMKGGSIVVPLTKHQLHAAIAVAPDGSLATLNGLEPTSFSRPRSLVVRIVDADGQGVAGTKVALSSVPYLQGPWDDPIPVDAEGRARFRGLAPTKHTIYAFPTLRRPHGRGVGEVDLGPGDAVRDVVVGAERTMLVRVSVDGRPGIPRRLWWKIAQGILTHAAIDRAKGVVRLRARPEADAPATGSIELGGEHVRSRKVAFQWPQGGASVSVDAALFGSPEVIVEVRADPDADSVVYLERWCPWSRQSSWLAARNVYPHMRGRTRIELESGRYRLHDYATGVFSEPFHVPEHGGRVRATLDLTGLVTIRGRIDFPEAFKDADVQIGVEGEGIDAQMSFTLPFSPRRGLSCDGHSFAVRVPAGRPVTLRPWHDTLQPAREGGEVTLVGPRDDVILKMRKGATLVMKLVDPDLEPLPPGALRDVQIAAVPSDHPSRPAVVVRATPVEGRAGVVSASGLPFGTLDLWVSSNRYAVCRLERARIAEDASDLGQVRLSRGARVRIRRVDEDGGPLRIEHCHANAMQGLWAWVNFDRSTSDAALGQFKGLGAGRWYLVVEGTRQTPAGDVHVRREFEIDVDGENDQTLDVDFSK